MSGKLKNRKTGFTLIEVLAGASIAIILGAVVITLYLTGRQSYTTGTALLELNGYTRVALEWMSKDIRWAEQVMPDQTIGTQTYNTATNELVLKLPSIDNNGDIIADMYDYVVYYLNDSITPARLERIVVADIASSRTDGIYIVADGVGSLILSSDGNELSNEEDVTTLTSIAIDLTVSKTVLGDRNLQNNQTTVIKLRNKE